MKYILILFWFQGVSGVPTTVGPFDNVFACEKALSQAQSTVKHLKGTCVDLNAKPHHWNGKELPK